MAELQLFTQADLERALGAPAILRQLADPGRTNQVDAGVVKDIIDIASTEMCSYVQLAVDLATLQQPYPRVLVLKAADMGAYHAWLRGAQGQGVPAEIIQRYENAVRWAQDVGQRRATIGTTVKPTLDPPASQVVADPDGTRVSVEGFKRGFR